MQPAHRLFFAVQPPALERRLIGCVRDRHPEIVHEVANDRLHGTIAITDDFPDFPAVLAERMLAIGDAAFAAPHDIILDRLSGSARSLALRPGHVLRGVADLARQLHGPMLRAGILRPGWSFSFHVTLGYRDGGSFTLPVDPLGWHATEFVLIHSIVGRTKHIVLRRWPLVPRQLSLFD
jgi:RNA 2',3'-cyclic 3'-phosphodiesterase